MDVGDQKIIEIHRLIGVRETARRRETWPLWGWSVSMASTGSTYEDRSALIRISADVIGIEASDELTFTTRTAELLGREIVLAELTIRRRIPPLFDDWRRELAGEDA